MKLRFSSNFRIERRKDRKTGEVITTNVPIRLDFTYDGNRLTYFTGYRIDADKWIDSSSDSSTGEKIKVQRVKRNAVNKEGVQYNIINTYLDRLKNSIEGIYIKAKASDITVDNAYICNALDELLGNKVNTTSSDSIFWDKCEEYINTHDVSEGRRRHLRATRSHFRRFVEASNINISFEELKPTLIKQFELHLAEEGGSEEEIDSNKYIGQKKSQNTITTRSALITQYKFSDY